MELNDVVISVITLAHNDSDIVLGRLLGIKKILSSLECNYEILVVDNNSTDETVEEITSLKSLMKHTRIIVLSKEYNEETALTAGLDSCIGDFAILFSLYTDPTELVESLVNELNQGSNIIVGKVKKKEKEGYLSKSFN